MANETVAEERDQVQSTENPKTKKGKNANFPPKKHYKHRTSRIFAYLSLEKMDTYMKN